MIYINRNGLEIRPIAVSDALTIKLVRDECLEFIHDSKSYTLEETVQWILSADSKYLIVLENSTAVGYFRLSNVTVTSCFVGMDLAKEHRGRGIAVNVYRVVLEELSKYGIKQFYLKVLKNNTHAIRLYKYLGFIEISDTDRDITMIKQI